MQKILTLKQLIEKEYLIVCPLLDIDRFISFCKDRSINTSKEQLNQFERLGIFFPIARIARPKIKVKIEYVNNGKEYRILGALNNGEEWSGVLREEYANFSFEKKYAENWIEKGFLWDPSTRDFEESNLAIDEVGWHCEENYYSIFQCYSLYNLIRSTKFEIHAEWWYSYDKEKIKKITDDLSEWAKGRIDSLKENGIRGENSSLICQVLSNRFFPKTQSDRRIFNLSTSIDHRNWDWYKYCHSWDSKSILNEIGISIDELKDLHQIVSMDAQNADPLKHWYELVKFVSIEEKKQLKGNALLAQTIYSMEEMIRMFYEDITGEKLDTPSEGMGFKLENYYGKGIVKDNLRYLEFLSNRYHLNPRPRLILVVEGNGEEAQLPRLSEELFGYPFTKLGVEVYNLEGVGEFTGKKRSDRYGALEKFIDYHHYRQTIVFIVLDGEGRTISIKNKLLNAPSKLFKKRYLTKTEYIVIWERKTIEFENFNNNEIAKALTAISNNQFEFKESEIENCRLLSRKKDADQLSILFKEKTGFGLSKPELLRMLFGFIIDNGKKEFSSDGGPIRSVVKVIRDIIKLASLNHQPSRLDSWEKNQESGYFGSVKKEK